MAMIKNSFKTSIHRIDLEAFWHIPGQLPHPALTALLAAKNQLMVLTHGRPPYRVVLAVPHHVPSGWAATARSTAACISGGPATPPS